jgi:hypothetical protein
VDQGGVSINGERVATEPAPVQLLHNRFALIRKGSRSFALGELPAR